MKLTAMWALCLRWVGQVDLLTGHPDEALQVADDMLRECHNSGEAGHEAWAHYLKGAALSQTQCEDRALQSLDEALALTRKLNMIPLRAQVLWRRAEVRARGNRKELAAEDKKASTALLRDMKMNYWLEQHGANGAAPI